MARNVFRGLMAYILLHPNGGEPSLHKSSESDETTDVVVRSSNGAELARLTYDQIDDALRDVDEEELRSKVLKMLVKQKENNSPSNPVIAKKTYNETHPHQASTTIGMSPPLSQVAGTSRYKAVCLTMYNNVNQEELQNCLDEYSSSGWVLKSITRSEKYSLRNALLDQDVLKFEMVLIFERPMM